MAKSLEGKVALVTGAGSGIGRATSVALAAAGARVLAVDVDEARLDALARELGDGCVFRKRVDVSKKDEMEALASEVHAAHGALDVLVNNAGVGHSGGVLDSSLQDWEWVLGVNLWGVVYGCHFFVPKMVERRAGGHVVNIASGFGLVAGSGVAPYCTTKFAVVGLSESMRAELAPHGIGVSAVCPGVIDTDIVARGRFTDESLREKAVRTFRKRGHPPEQVARAVLRAIRRDVAVVPVGAEAWAAWLGKRFAPGLAAIAGRRIEQLARNGA
jgi:NAD(P)-dependent dehydrogenase (short-subunit alcohol dehydrogenase family)